MKRYLSTLAVVIVACGALFSLSMAEVVNGIACKVGREIITINEFEKAYQYAKHQALFFSEKPFTKREVMRDLIDKVLVEREAKRKGIVVSEDEIDTNVENIRKQNQLSEEDFLSELEKQNMTVEMLRDRYRLEILKSRLMRQFIGDRRYQIPDEEIEAFYRDPKNHRFVTLLGTVKLRVIFIPVGEVSYKEAMDLKNRAVEAYERAKSGEDFSALASEFSLSDETERTGGYIGSFTREQLFTMMAPDDVDMIFSLDGGDVTSPMRFKDGYRVFKIEERTDSKKLSLEESYEYIKSYLLNLKGEELFKEWLIEVREATTIQYMIDMG